MKQTLHDKIYDHPFVTIIVSLVIAAVIAVVILSPFVWLAIHTNEIDMQRGVENYNDGICKECGGELEYRGSSRDDYRRYDYYICPNGHVVEVYHGRETATKIS